MGNEKPFVEVRCYDDLGDPMPPNNYRPELIIGDQIMLLDSRKYGKNNGCMGKEEANSLARKIASHLGIDVKLKD